MNVLVLGSGGREDAVCTKLLESRRLEKLYVMPGNGGIGRKASLIPGSVMDKDAVYRACLDHDIQYVVVTPDDPLADGMVDFLSERGIKAFGPDSVQQGLCKRPDEEIFDSYCRLCGILRLWEST